ncbi:hypothetical protein ACFOZ0_11415 [Streptomyces yaanensis]|uniref:Uncharacterized protein n=1 Tax=Streptomyces yaanensis TaxID=1142239 RepID=A0ABV7SCI6_9ACTN|nr:hypothetical protein [Streptomyces sp. CGMCC 4.7035]WNB96938.1 hypothetical protein Q2K21_01995 [Streptomyces sp. CGMCC 4.7035]
MPTPHGSRGGLAFGAEELRVLRRALALALQPRTASAEDVQDCLRLAESVDEAVREGARLRAFLLADLARYRAGLPGAVAGYCALLEEALGAGYRPLPDDLAALRSLRGTPAVAALLDHCGALAERDARARLALRTAMIPTSRVRLTALRGGRAGAPESADGPARKPADKPTERPEKPGPPPEPGTPRPSRPIPTPGEVFPPKRKPAPPAHSERQLVAG